MTGIVKILSMPVIDSEMLVLFHVSAGIMTP
jgi:hypothetical protein